MSSENHKSAHDAVADTRPVFTTPARPHEIPKLLQVLQADTAILVRSELGEWGGLTTARVSDYIQQLEAVMQRQADGFFTLNEAAQVLADSRGGIDFMRMVGEMATATVNGARMARDPGDHMPIRGCAGVSAWYHVIKVADIDAWLTECGTGYLFPPTVDPETPKQRRARLLAMFDAEVLEGGERGALTRVFKREKRTRPTADRSNVGKEVTKARAERDAERRGGGLTHMLR